MNTTGSATVQARTQDVVLVPAKRRPVAVSEADIERAISEAFSALFRRGVLGNDGAARK